MASAGGGTESAVSDQVLRDMAYVMKKLGVKRSTLQRLIDAKALAYVDISTGVHVGSGPLKGVRRNRVYRFLDADLEDFITRRRVAKDEPLAKPKLAASGGSRRPMLQLPGADRYLR